MNALTKSTPLALINLKDCKEFMVSLTHQEIHEQHQNIGSTERLMSRIAPYNTGRPKEDDYYYITVYKEQVGYINGRRGYNSRKA